MAAAIVFVAAKLVKKYNLTVNVDTRMVVTLADVSQVKMCETCSVPIMIYTMSKKTVFCMI